MGQCMSRKAAGALAASAAAINNKPGNKMEKKKNNNNNVESPGDDYEEIPRKVAPSSALKGVSSSFGFKRSVATTITSNSNAARRLATNDVIEIDRNGNDNESLTQNMAPTGRSTPKLQPPKKEGIASKINRFGFRQPQVNRLHKVTDLNKHPQEFHNNNKVKKTAVVDTNRNKLSRYRFTPQQPQAEKYLLHSDHLPVPEPIRVIETKAAKTLANTSRKNQYHEDNSSKDGSLTEDSGVCSQISSDFIGLEKLNQSPGFVRKNRTRHLEVVVSGKKFDVRDFEEVNQPPQEQSPALSDYRGAYLNSGFVREKAQEYQRRQHSRSSTTSSDGHSDEEAFQNSYMRKNNFPKANFLHKFDSSSDSDWIDAGEAMADEMSFSSSSIEKNCDYDDTKFVAVVKENMSIQLLDETSPIENWLPSFSEDDEMKRKSLMFKEMQESTPNQSFTNEVSKSPQHSKDINEKLTPQSPGTSTNNSLSLSEGKDDFLIDDEIADQPGLVFEGSVSQNNSESTNTLKDSVQKVRRRNFAPNSPLLSLRKKKTFLSRAGSLDTLSPCDSIASDDLMMDYEHSQESGLEDFDKSQLFDETIIASNNSNELNDSGNILRDWSALLSCNNDNRSLSNSAKPRLLASRTGTPSSVPDSPKLSEVRKSRQSLNNSPLRLSRTGLNYDSDDSARLERSNQAAIAQDVIGIKTLLLKLKRVLSESETHIPFEDQFNLTNGLFPETQDESKLQMADLRRQNLFLQGQIEDKDRRIQELEQKLSRVDTQDVATVERHNASVCNAATQTDRIRPVSMDMNGSSPTDGGLGSLVSANESQISPPSPSNGIVVNHRKTPPIPKLWRKPGDPPTTSSAIPKRAASRTRTTNISSSQW